MMQMVSVDNLEIGMYVARLDRPWLETPFLFQGFYIRDNDEIQSIKSYCKHVYVSADSSVPAPETGDVSGADVNEAEFVQKPRNGKSKKAEIKAETSEDKSADTKPFSLRSLFGFGKSGQSDEESPPKDLVYEETTSLKDEIHTASAVQKQAAETVHGVMQNLKKSGRLDLERVEAAVTPMVDSVLRNPAALACLIRMQKKDNYLYHHSLASSVWATILGRQIGLARADLDVIALGAMLLDVGKTKLPDEILLKPEKLDDAEQKLMRQHVRFGLDILKKSGEVDPRVRDMVAHHHERYNGTGYPKGLEGNDIPVFGRIAGIVDAYDAMITPRPYAQLQSSYDALRKLRVLSDVEFQAEIVDQFTRAIGAFPTGTLIELSTGEVAIVTKQNRIRRLRPEVMVVMDADKQLLENFRVIDLNEEKVAKNGALSLWIERGLPPGAHGIDPTEFYLN